MNHPGEQHQEWAMGRAVLRAGAEETRMLVFVSYDGNDYIVRAGSDGATPPSDFKLYAEAYPTDDSGWGITVRFYA